MAFRTLFVICGPLSSVHLGSDSSPAPKGPKYPNKGYLYRVSVLGTAIDILYLGTYRVLFQAKLVDMSSAAPLIAGGGAARIQLVPQRLQVALKYIPGP